MAWSSFRFAWRNITTVFRPIGGTPREEPPQVPEPAHVDQRAPLGFGGCGRLSRSLADRLPHLFDSDLASPFDTMNRRPFDHGHGSETSRTMQDQAAASAVGWNAAQSHVVPAEQRVLQPGAGGNVGAVANFATDLLVQQATFPPGGGDTEELANTLTAAVENLGGVEALLLQTTRLHTRPAYNTPGGHRHAKRVLLPKAIRSEEKTRLDQEVVRDGIYTEHRGDTQLRELHDDLPGVLDRLIEVRGMGAMVDPSRTSVRVNIFVAPTECEVGLRVRYHVPAAPGSTRSITWCAEVKDMDVDAQTVTLERDEYNALVGCIWAEEHRDVPVSCLSAMGVWRNDVVLTAAGACAKRVCHSPLTYCVTHPSFSTGGSSTPGLAAHQDNDHAEMPALCVPHYRLYLFLLYAVLLTL